MNYIMKEAVLGFYFKNIDLNTNPLEVLEVTDNREEAAQYPEDSKDRIVQILDSMSNGYKWEAVEYIS